MKNKLLGIFLVVIFLSCQAIAGERLLDKTEDTNPTDDDMIWTIDDPTSPVYAVSKKTLAISQSISLTAP